MTVPGAWLRALSVAAAVLVCDQATKQAALEGLAGRMPVEIALGLELVLVRNTGIAFGLLTGAGVGVVIVVALSAVAFLVAWFATEPTRPGMALAVGLLVGGALGNLADRVRDGAVIDFIDPPLWPAFNLADVAVTAGVIVLIGVHLRATSQ